MHTLLRLLPVEVFVDVGHWLDYVPCLTHSYQHSYRRQLVIATRRGAQALQLLLKAILECTNCWPGSGCDENACFLC